MVIFHGYVNHNQMVTYINCCFWIWCPPGIAVVFLHPSWHRWTSGISTTSGRHRSVHCSRSLWSWDMVEELCGWFTPKFGRKFIYIIIYIYMWWFDMSFICLKIMSTHIWKDFPSQHIFLGWGGTTNWKLVIGANYRCYIPPSLR